MKKAGYGSFITLLTCAAFTPILPQLIYGSTKSGLEMLTRYIAKLAGPEVRANCICPGTVTLDGKPAPQFGNHLDSVPLQRFGTPDEVAAAALFLASPASSYTTAQTIFCEGGRVRTVA